jgi:predicted RNase H-like HicB family nuclease
MKYLVEVFWSDDDEGYIALVPDLPGCSAFGATPEAAVHEIGDATLAWIAACRASGDPIPEPTATAPSGLNGREISIVSPERPRSHG